MTTLADTLADSVAVVTGAGSGIGFALASAAVRHGCKVVLADIREEPLQEAATKLRQMNGDVFAVQADVATYPSVQALADAAFAQYGKVNLLFNNAGVFASGLTWEVSLEEYDWVIGVNQKSVIHGIKAFVPRMIAQGDPCHVINTASGAGITANPGFCSYSMTKHAVVSLSETLWLDLQSQGITNIGVTCVMPGVVQSKIMFPEKTGPQALQGELESRLGNRTLGAVEGMMRAAVSAGLPADSAAEMVFDAIQRNALYVLPNFTDEGSQAMAKAIAVGRATGENAYPAILDGLLKGIGLR